MFQQKAHPTTYFQHIHIKIIYTCIHFFFFFLTKLNKKEVKKDKPPDLFTSYLFVVANDPIHCFLFLFVFGQSQLFYNH